jgi:hypothetical protein
MFRAITRTGLLAALLLLGGRSASAYSIYGPTNAEAFQIPAIGYNVRSGAAASIIDLATPRNIGEQYRWNTPFLYYACDANFLDYFGATGAAEVDKAFAVYNNTLSNVSSYSSNMIEWPLNTARFNFRAEALQMVDLKSAVVQLIAEQLGLAQAERWVWCLFARISTGPCPSFTYNVIMRNYDPTTGFYSAYVNGTLYGYNVIENCALNPNPFAPVLADAVEYPIDPTAPTFTTVASFSIPSGRFYTGLTRDDAAGLRYLMTRSNAFVEPAGTNNLLVVTNGTSLTTIVTSNLALLLSASLTNSGAQLQGLFPGLLVNSSTLIGFSNVVTATTGGFFVNNPFAPVGTPPTFVVTTILTTNLVQVFSNTFGNVVVTATNNQSAISVTANGVTSIILTNQPGGEYILVPANQCGFTILSTNLGTVTTNISVNTTVITNGTTNTTVIGTVFTNHILVVAIPTCVSNNVALRRGMDRIPQFFRQDFDSLLSQFWSPVTNTFTLTAVSNNAPVTQFFSRTVVTPDFIITAQDNGAGLGSRTAQSFARANAGNGLGGPGIIEAPGTGGFELNKTGPLFAVTGSATVIANDFAQSLDFNWGSFDGTTNTPVLYPDANSLANLENQVFLQITGSGPLPTAQKGQFYTTTLTATGVEPPPYTWSVAPNSPALPTGLHISSTGTISGTPLVSGIFDFSIQVQDDTGRASQRNFALQVNP